ncbi:MAG TPA: hypothetical protein VLB84_03340, partial [Bacteroidia bacterium]|nr:hypothetical protein [Bacteroidia bacterium]
MVENVIEIIRYIRVSDERFSHDLKSPDKFFDHDNLYGITMLFTIDYNSMVVKAKHSVCNGDNFSKEEGKSRRILLSNLLAGKVSEPDVALAEAAGHGLDL